MLILASQSPRRRELMKLITEDFIATAAEVDETLPENIMPNEAVLHLSKIKAEPFVRDGDIVIGADTIVSVDGMILGKPKDTEDARRMLHLLSGKCHSVFTGYTVMTPQKSVSCCVETKVYFYSLSDDEIDRYLATGEPYDKAGAYGIQGYGSLLVERIEGDYFNIVGLPVSRLVRTLSKFNH